MFKAFFEKIVLPSVRNQPRIMEEWKYLTSIVAEESIDFSRLDNYMTSLNQEKLVSSGTNSKSSAQANLNISSRKELNDTSSREYRPYRQETSMSEYGREREREREREGRGIEDQKKKLLGILEGFHGSLIKNQQKLDNDFRKE